MEPKTLKAGSWSELKEVFESITVERAELKSKTPGHVSKVLFRGLSNAEWGLETTLERAVNQRQSLLGYYRNVAIARNRIEAYSRDRWDFPDFEHIVEELEKRDLYSARDFPAYDFLAHLRHHGFPSPLLDWTQSYYIAAFFAFEKVLKPEQCVAIYAYREHAGTGKSHSGDNPHIVHFGSNLRTSHRHYLQQSEYTVCLKAEQHAHGTKKYFVPHKDVFGLEENQDLFYKIVVPGELREEALRELNLMNINSLSLFNSLESLMSTLGTQLFLLSDW